MSDLEKRSGYVVWVEGRPEGAKWAGSYFSKWWLEVFYFGWSMRRVSSYWPALPEEDHVELARNMERAIVLYKKHFER